MRKSKISDETRNEIISEINNGQGLSATAKKFGVSLSTIRNIKLSFQKPNKTVKASKKIMKEENFNSPFPFPPKKSIVNDFHNNDEYLKFIGELILENKILKTRLASS